MPDVLVYERASPSFAASLAKRGHHIVYRANESNHCPGCGRSHWYIGRVSAECGFCGTAIPLAEARRNEALTSGPRPTTTSSADQRRHPRMAAPIALRSAPRLTIFAMSKRDTIGHSATR